MRELREFSEMKKDEDKNAEETERMIKKHGAEQVLVNCLRLNNNKISSWTRFTTSVRSIINPAQISWLDLSFNQLPTIDPALTGLTNLRKLHLHANCITNILDVQNLTELQRLTDLTLHGNPIEERGRQKYKSFIIGTLPNLRSLDFTPLTARDKALAQTFYSNPSLKRTIMTEEDKPKQQTK